MPNRVRFATYPSLGPNLTHKKVGPLSARSRFWKDPVSPPWRRFGTLFPLLRTGMDMDMDMGMGMGMGIILQIADKMTIFNDVGQKIKRKTENGSIDEFS